MRILVTGSRGFIGRNLVTRLTEAGVHEVLEFTRQDAPTRLPELISQADAVVHLAGSNRPTDPADFELINVGLTRELTDALLAAGRAIPLVLASSIRVLDDTPYGRSKRDGERVASNYAELSGHPVSILRLPNVFGKWCRPDYNSVVATFCHNIARDLPIRIDNPHTELELVHVDTVVDAILAALGNAKRELAWPTVGPTTRISLGDLAARLREFRQSRQNLVIDAVGTGFLRALYSTYVSYLPPDLFTYDLVRHEDARGTFVEFVRTGNAGQMSFFTARPGATRGAHYHHTKTEKFLVLSGTALFRFRNLDGGETLEIIVRGEESRVVETVPGWIHSISNIGQDELIVMLWVNEIFDENRPDTIARQP